jgi:predicted RNase H-like HicB family nuclease
MQHYIALIHKDADSDYGVSFPDFPGAITAGKTLDEARAMAAEALALHVEGMVADREAVPEPSSLEAVMSDPDNRDGVAILVGVGGLNAKAVRINITIQEDVLREIDAFAKAKGLTRSAFLASAARAAIQKEAA